MSPVPRRVPACREAVPPLSFSRLIVTSLQLQAVARISGGEPQLPLVGVAMWNFWLSSPTRIQGG